MTLAKILGNNPPLLLLGKMGNKISRRELSSAMRPPAEPDYILK
jgi:hypothetical protein